MIRLLVKVFFPIAVIAVAAAGFLPPLLEQGNLDNQALNAARAGSALLVSSGSAQQAMAAVAESISHDPGLHLDSVVVNPAGTTSTVKVTVSETVHTFLDGIPGMKSWFHRTATEESSVGT